MEERPWGKFLTILKGPGFQVKSIVVRPNSSLSLQYHLHRSEYWVVVRGIATVTCDDKHLELEVGGAIQIPVGVRHRLENMQLEELEVIEVQLGTVLSEEDIVRIEDRYGRDSQPTSKSS